MLLTNCSHECQLNLASENHLFPQKCTLKPIVFIMYLGYNMLQLIILVFCILILVFVFGSCSRTVISQTDRDTEVKTISSINKPNVSQ